MVADSQATQSNEYKLLSEIVDTNSESLPNTLLHILDIPSQNEALVSIEIQYITKSIDISTPHYQ